MAITLLDSGIAEHADANMRMLAMVAVPEIEGIVIAHSRWRGLDRPSAEQSREVSRFIGQSMAPLLVPELAKTREGAGDD